MTANLPAVEPTPQQQQPPANQAAPALATNKYSAANDLMFEDCLKSIMLKSKTGKTYSSYKNKYCPKAKQSAFGDFPPEYLPKKQPVAFASTPETGSTSMAASMRSNF